MDAGGSRRESVLPAGFCVDGNTMAAETKSWKNRIVEYADVSPDQLLANPKNFRRHPGPQQNALQGMIDEVGYLDPVLCQKSTGMVIDGHLRVELAMRANQSTLPVAYVDLTDAEADLALATYDPIGALAYADTEQLKALLDDVSTGDAAVMAMLSELAAKEGIVPPDFDPVGIDDQGRLDEKAKVTCPECGHVF